MFDQDLKEVMRFIKEFTIGTTEYAWTKQVKCGHVSLQKLQEHYDGKFEVERRKTQARQAIKKFHYRHEHTFPFEKYITAHQSNFHVLERFDVSLYEKDKETYLLNKISVNNKEIKTTISIIRRRLATFNEAYSYLTTEACMIPPQTSSVYRRSSINVMNGGRGCSHKHGGGSFGGLGRGNETKAR